jgi:hypothetical protein
MDQPKTLTSSHVCYIFFFSSKELQFLIKNTEFICDTLTNSCGADQTAKNTCAQGRAAASAASRGTGAQADAFNSAFGIQTVRLWS